jgi:hypothetical protein
MYYRKFQIKKRLGLQIANPISVGKVADFCDLRNLLADRPDL